MLGDHVKGEHAVHQTLELQVDFLIKMDMTISNGFVNGCLSSKSYILISELSID